MRYAQPCHRPTLTVCTCTCQREINASRPRNIGLGLDLLTSASMTRFWPQPWTRGSGLGSTAWRFQFSTSRTRSRHVSRPAGVSSRNLNVSSRSHLGWCGQRLGLGHYVSCPSLTIAQPQTLVGRPFIKRFALSYRTVVCLSVCLSCPVKKLYCGQTAGWINSRCHLVGM